MNVAAFAVVIARERETALGDDIEAVAGIGASRPALAWPLTISMLALAGFPGTAGFIGKFFLIEATVDGGFTWLGVVIVIGSMVSLAYYLRVVAAVWMRPGAEPVRAAPVMAGGSAEAGRLGGRVARRAGRGASRSRCSRARPWSASGSSRARCSTSPRTPLVRSSGSAPFAVAARLDVCVRFFELHIGLPLKP